jgi:hypothetical protein
VQGLVTKTGRNADPIIIKEEKRAGDPEAGSKWCA